MGNLARKHKSLGKMARKYLIYVPFVPQFWALRIICLF